MAHVALETETANVAAEASPFGEAFEAAWLAFIRDADAASEAKGASSEARKACANSERQAAWAAFDVVVKWNDENVAREALAKLALDMAEKRGVSENSLPNYASRGAWAWDYRADIVKAGQPVTMTKGKRKGETVNPRETVNPFTLAKSLRAEATERQQRLANAQKEAANYGAEASDHAAKLLSEAMGVEVTSDMLPTLALSEPEAVREAMAQGLTIAKARGERLAMLRDALALFEGAGEEAKATAREIVAKALA